MRADILAHMLASQYQNCPSDPAYLASVNADGPVTPAVRQRLADWLLEVRETTWRGGAPARGGVGAGHGARRRAAGGLASVWGACCGRLWRAGWPPGAAVRIMCCHNDGRKNNKNDKKEKNAQGGIGTHVARAGR